MKISSIVVTYNAGKWIEKCLASLRNSSIPSEIIVIDNHSTDNTLSIIETGFQDVRLIRNKENAGFGKANNLGISLAYNENADFIFLLNQDAWVEPNTIEVLVKKQIENPEFGIVSPLHFFDAETLDKKFKSYIKSSKAVDYNLLSVTEKEQIYGVRFVNAAVWLMSRECITTVGLFAPVFSHYGEDLDYAHRCKFHNIKIGVLPAVKAYHERPQETPDENRIATGKLLERDENYCLGVLLNLKHSYLRQWFFLLFISLKNCIIALVQFRFKTAFVIFSRLKVLMRMKELRLVRKVLKQPGAYLK
ncbi:MAG TPA: family 2 glycosyl transferase [Prolixibacteraceae bacterium]|nr:family 2 glycosyl transferase [Prolixibacteraceae bacterium]